MTRSTLFTCALRSILTASILTASSLTAQAAELMQQPDTTMEMTAAATDAELDSSRGAFLPSGLALNNVEQTAQDKNNVVIGGVTGANTISGSFTNTQGLVNVIQNSGNNVVIQSSTIVNLSFK